MWVFATPKIATWMINIFTGSPFLISLMSTVASLPFFLFTLPAGALADKVDRQRLICLINVGLAATALGLAVLGWLSLLNPYLILVAKSLPLFASSNQTTNALLRNEPDEERF